MDDGNGYNVPIRIIIERIHDKLDVLIDGQAETNQHLAVHVAEDQTERRVIRALLGGAGLLMAFGMLVMKFWEVV